LLERASLLTVESELSLPDSLTAIALCFCSVYVHANAILFSVYGFFLKGTAATCNDLMRNLAIDVT
jgi:hypothetical protein